MRVLTLCQPWATLMAHGLKRIETRSWATRYVGPLAIHAGRERKYLRLCAEEPFLSALISIGIAGPRDLPLGEVLSIGELIRCVPTDFFLDGLVKPFTERDAAFGDFSRGRYAWVTNNMRRLATPLPHTGSQGLRSWEPPEGIRYAV